MKGVVFICGMSKTLSQHVEMQEARKAQRISTGLEQTFYEAQYRMKQQGITQNEMAEMLNLSVSTMSLRMNDYGKFRVSEFMKFCEIVGVEL